MTAAQPRTVVSTDPASADWLALQGRLADLALGSSPSAAGVGVHLTQSRHLAFLPPEVLDLDLTDPLQRDFGEYELLEKLGQGGMGVVYRARQRALDREVAVKLLAAGPWASKDFIERFQREAQSAARMQHPNIVPIFEIGAHDELNFFSMALVRGPTLAQMLAQQGPFEPRAAAQLVRTVAEALDYAHKLGVLHLDLKPGNVLVDERGVPQVADFGLARRIDDALGTDSDEVSGTPSYMAPEQAQIKSHKLSPATDIYGLGAILYELLSGHPPFLAATPQETLKRVVTQEPVRLRTLRKTLPQDLEAVALKCLAKHPKERYPSARALADDLGRFLDGRAVSVRPLNAPQRAARWARREPRVAIAAGAFVFALVSGLVATAVQWRRADANAVAARNSTWELRAQAAEATLTDGDGFAALRPLLENLREMEAAGRAGDALVQRQRIGALLANAPRLLDYRPLPGNELVFSLAVSPDGERYALGLTTPDNKRLVRQYDVATGRELWSTLTVGLTFALPFSGNPPHGNLVYSPDGTRLMATLMDQSPFPAPRIADGIAFDVRDGRVLTPPGQDKHLDIVYSDDARVGMVRYRSNPSFRFPDGAQFYAVDPWQTLGPRQTIGGSIGADMWLPTTDGRWFLGSSDFIEFTLFEKGTLRAIWRLKLPDNDRVLAWRFNSDASRLALGTMSGAVYLVDTRDGSYVPLRSTPISIIRWLEFGSDDRILAASAEDGTIMTWDVPSLAPLATPLQGPGGMPRGRVIDGQIFTASDNQLRIWALPPQGPFDNTAVPAVARVRTRRQLHADGYDVHPASRLLVAGGSEGAVSLWRLPPPVLLPARAAPLPPRRIAYDGERIVAVDGTQVQLREPFSDAPLSVVWRHPDPVRLAELTADGRRLVTVAGRTVRVFDPASGEMVGEPLVLPQSPLRADLARVAPVLVLTTGEYVGDAFRERVHVVELAQATLRPVDAFLPFQVVDFQLSPGGDYLLAHRDDLTAEGIRSLDLIRLDGTSGRCDRVKPDDMNFPGDVAIADDGRSAWIYVLGMQRTARLERWNLETCSRLVRTDVQTGRTEPTLIATGDDVIVHRQSGEGLSRFGADASRHDSPGSSVPDALGVFALSRDARRAAVARRNTVQLIDIERGERLSAPLAAPIAGDDGIMKLAFSPDATQLVARTVRGRWLAWRLPVNRLEYASLTTLASLLDPAANEAPPGDDAIAALREDMQARMPEPVAAEAAPAAAVTLEPAAGSQADPRFVPVDLGPIINAPLNGNWPARGSMGGDQPTMAFGPLRLLDVDWRVDGGVQLSWGGPAGTLHPTQRASAVVPVADVVARRLHLLMLIHVFIQPDLKPFPAAHVVLIGADGRETVVSPMMVRDLVPHWTPDRAAPTARLGWLGLSGTGARSGYAPPGYDSHAYAVSLDVPPEVGPIRGLRLEAREGPMELPLFYAVTLETSPPQGADSLAGTR